MKHQCVGRIASAGGDDGPGGIDCNRVHAALDRHGTSAIIEWYISNPSIGTQLQKFVILGTAQDTIFCIPYGTEYFIDGSAFEMDRTFR